MSFSRNSSAVLQSDPDPTVIINADEKITHGRVIEVMDHVRLSGISNMAIATKAEEKEIQVTSFRFHEIEERFCLLKS